MNNPELPFYQISQISDVLCSLKFVSSYHHDGDPGLLKSSDSLRDLVLKFVLDGCGSKDIQMILSGLNEGIF